MFNPMRLFRRNNHIDDTATAYIEGRATDRDEAELRDRASRQPGLIEDLDSIRQTVSLLRSVETVAAPRSFALASVPVQVRRTRRPKLAMAPAVFAIAAAVVVGLLAVGNLADIVRQSDGTSTEQSNDNSAFDSVTITIGESAGGQGPAGATGPADSAETESARVVGDQARAATTPTITASQATSAPMPLPTTVPSEALVPVAPASGEDNQAALAPPVQEGGAALSLEGGSATQDSPPLVERSDNTVADESSPAATPAELPGEQDGASQPLALPQATVIGAIDTSDALKQLAGDSSPETLQPDRSRGDRSGLALPLWQLQVVFASIAVLMAGAWMLIQRRLTA